MKIAWFHYLPYSLFLSMVIVVFAEQSLIAQNAKDLWSFQVITQSDPPRVKHTDWPQNPIDNFVLKKLENAGMKPAPAATDRALIRRAYLDLIGLPPSPEEVTSFINSIATHGSVDAFKSVTERLLANPHYGERWARYWLDLVRYADSNGYEIDGEKPLAWQYRDYVIRAFNSDTPYDRFILEQLAGDELDNASPETVIATGFYRIGPWDAERGASVQPSEVIEERYNELDDMIRTTSQVFLGLTLGCARCHDHKFDPLTARDYYSMLAVFNPLVRPRKGRTELTRPAVPARFRAIKQQTDKQILALDTRIQTLIQPLQKAVLNSTKTSLPKEAIDAFREVPDARSDEQKKLIDQHKETLRQEVFNTLSEPTFASRVLPDTIIAQIRQSRKERSKLAERFHFPEGYFLLESSPDAPVTHILTRGNPKQPGRVVEPSVPESLVQQQPLFESPDLFTSRRRLSLARWITDPQNPLTARVMVNRVWQYHFGQGLVRSPSDFGKRGSTPTHPKLLDWLAGWFVHEAEWSLKQLHLLIMTSRTYRMNKQLVVEYDRQDPDNNNLWRFPYQRLDVEAIRDSMLAVSGQLNRTLYGPSMYPEIPDEARESGYDPGAAWQPFHERKASRRTIYAYVKRTLIVPLLDTLDFCDTTRSTARRDLTIVAPQALELLNGSFANRQAAHFADRLILEAGSNIDRQLELGFRLALTREVREGEKEVLKRFHQEQSIERALDGTQSEKETRRQALIQVCRIIFNLNEFVYAD